MPGIKFNQLTREIELTGSEAFIESNFDKIQELFAESLGVETRTMSVETRTIPEVVIVEPQMGIRKAMKSNESSAVSPIATEAQPSVSALSQDVKVSRPPLRKYIRKVGTPGHEKTVVEVAKQETPEISIEALREKFGLPESKIGGIIREAEKLGKVKRVMNGSYVWSQD